MAITRWDPFGEMLRMQRDMDRIFSRAGTAEGLPATTTAWMPRINVKQSGDDLAVHAELAGIRPEDVDPASIRADFRDGMLEIHVPRGAEPFCLG